MIRNSARRPMSAAARFPLMVSGAMLAPLIAFAAATPAQAQSASSRGTRTYDIPAQSLASGLREYMRQSGVQVGYPSEIGDKVTTSPVRGSLSAAEALSRLLTGTGLSFRFTGTNTATLERAPQAAGGAIQLGPVRVEGDAGGNNPSAASASDNRDITEGTRSYAASRVSLGKGQDIRETPQSITVITRQRIEDQGLMSVGDVMAQTAGVTTDYAGAGGLGGTANSFYARGFQMTNMQIDGASVDMFSQQTFDPNMAMYDSVQVVRGADGLYSANGEPGGTINLVRKRPLDHLQLLATGVLGSWNRRQAELDVAGPLALDGKVRGRMVVSHIARDFFYDAADTRSTLVYAILEADLTPSTLLTFGGSYEDAAGTPWRNGLPRAPDGSDLHLPRSTALLASWNHFDRDTREVFAQLEQQLGGDWRLKVHANHIRLSSDSRLTNGEGAVDPATGLGSELSGFSNDFASRKWAFDANVSGSFQMFGRQQKLLFGGDWTKIRDVQDTYFSQVDLSSPGLNVRGFDPNRVPLPSLVWRTRSFPDYGAIQKGLYGRLAVSPVAGLTAIAGARYSSYEYQSPYVRYDRAGNVTSSSMSAYRQSGIFTPYGGVLYDLDRRWTAYVSVAEIYKSQANNLAGPLPGEPLDAITGRNYEAGIKGELAQGRLTTSLAVYRIERNGEAVRDPNYPDSDVGNLGLNCCWLRQGRVRSEGFEAEVNGEVVPGLQLAAGYTFNNNSNLRENAKYSTITPRHLLKIWTTYDFQGPLEGLKVGAGVVAQTAQYVRGSVDRYDRATDPWTVIGAVPFEFTQKGYSVWNTSVEYRLSDRLSATANLNNIFDKTYYKTVGNSSANNWYGDPRNVMLIIRAKY
ncbi:MAG: TonB-dependent siderophore receptor [Sphingomonas phyllosphaerae]|uniref:TonB-dependent siderophore receptor n=1 Tax=Sphingomonas phyllosphaerae TaxID=257003 RepID=UPI002FF60B41